MIYQILPLRISFQYVERHQISRLILKTVLKTVFKFEPISFVLTLIILQNLFEELIYFTID